MSIFIDTTKPRWQHSLGAEGDERAVAEAAADGARNAVGFVAVAARARPPHRISSFEAQRLFPTGQKRRRQRRM